MKLVARIFSAILFVLFFGFALKNAHEVDLRFFLNIEWHTPLALLLLGFFAAGAVLGVLAMTPTVFRKQREISKYKTALGALQKENELSQSAQNQTPQADSVLNK